MSSITHSAAPRWTAVFLLWAVLCSLFAATGMWTALELQMPQKAGFGPI
jgi:hypothetical protein